MKVVAVFGSPHENGASARIARKVLEGAKAAGHEIVEYHLNVMNLRGCQACGVCKREKVDCIQPDDLKPY